MLEHSPQAVPCLAYTASVMVASFLMRPRHHNGIYILFHWAGTWAGAPIQAIQPRLLLCGPEGAGQRHLAPAVLYALEGLPVHALGLPALLSDASARFSSFSSIVTYARFRV